MTIKKVLKRDGRIESFDQSRITNAILKAILATNSGNGELAKELSNEVVKTLEDKFRDRTPSVEDIQDAVESVLIKRGLERVAKAYIIYRQKRAEIREYKKFFEVTDDLKLSVNAIKVLKSRYLLKDGRGKVIETPSQMFRRVAAHIASAELMYDKNADTVYWEEEFYRLMSSLEFLPNSPTLMNAGTALGQLSACFVLPVEDSLEGIFNTLKYTALIHQSGGGTGFSFSRIRPKGDIVRSTMGVASGPISFMRIFDVATEVIKQGGKRRGANMGILHVSHPDIVEFVTCKSTEGAFSNFNISVAVTDEFMKAVEDNKPFDLVNPRTNKVVKQINAKSLFDLIVTMAWKTGDPGLIFIDEINRRNPTPHIGVIESTNPCGEQPLLPFESCNLGSINLSKMVKDHDVDWDKLGKTVELAVRFLDNVIDVNKYPIPEIERTTKANRKIGLGVMGWADMLIKLGIPYDSEEALNLAEKIMSFITNKARETSVKLGEERGSFPNFKGSIWEKKGYKAMRNATVTTIAPTGTISIIAGCSSGIEPLFAVAFVRNVMEGVKLLEVNSLFEQVARDRGFYSRELMLKIAKTGSIQQLDEVPNDVKKIFKTALDISPEWHVRMQAAFQKYTDNAVAKTVNLPPEATLEDVRNVFMLAWKLKCKGVTVYRYGSKKEQVLYVGSILAKELLREEEHVVADSEYAGGCPVDICPH